MAVYKDGVRISLGLGRGGWAKVLPWGFIVILAGIGAIMALVVGAAERLGGPGTAAEAGFPSHSEYYGIASMVTFVFASLVAPELLCRDKRDGVISLYLVRPLTGTDYILARWAAFLSVMLVALWIPQTILFMGLCMSDADPLAYFQKNWLDIPRFLLSGVAMAAYVTTIALLTASFTTRRAYASVFLVGVFVVTMPFTLGLSQEIDGPTGQWISMFSLGNIPVHVNDLIFGGINEMTDRAPARELGPTVLVAWFFAWTLIPFLILWSRYRKLSP
jgi:ABC-type transport system involved in multi-copper enzyme maturation permease subunit